MTREQLVALLAHLPEGTEIQLSFRLEGAAAGASAAAASEARAPVPAIEPEPMKIKAAATRYRVPERELKRAIKAGFVPHTTKTDGRDAGAQLLARADLERYVERRDAIRAFREPPPENWSGPGGRR